ncbi:retrovirus-related pol polyprotein from transposon TNT 1-94 [Tanacetum coccineum]
MKLLTLSSSASKIIQVRLNAIVHNVRTDNGTEFVNQTLRDFYENVGIPHQTVIASTPQQNGIVERQNRTLVEAARTMLIVSKAPLFLWAEAINTACYTQNRSLIRPGLQVTTPATSSLGLVPNIIPQQPFPVAATPRAVKITDSPVSTSIDQDAPSSKSPKTPLFHHDHLHEFLHEDSTSQGSSFNVRPSHTLFELIGRWTKDHPIENVIGDPSLSVSTIKQLKTDAVWCYFDAFLTYVEPKNFKQAMTKPSWIDAMQEEIHEFERLLVLELVSCLDKVMLIKLKWIYKVKTDDFGRVLKNKARLAQGFRKEEGINFEESFAPVARIKAIRAVDPTLFIRKARNGLLLVQTYVDNIIFASTNTALCNEFANQMTTKFKMSMMVQMLFFLGLQISQSPRGIYLNQSKYASEIIKKYGLLSSDSVDRPMVEKNKLDEDLQGDTS